MDLSAESKAMPLGGDTVQFDSVCFGEGGAAELEGRQALIFVPRAEITRVEVAFTQGVHHPFLIGVVGVAVILASVLFPLLAVINGAQSPRVLYLLPFVIPGAWMIVLAVRKRWVTVVHTQRGRRHLIFQKSHDRAAMEEFLGKVRGRYGYL